MQLSWRTTYLSKEEELRISHVIAVLASVVFTGWLSEKFPVCIRFEPAIENAHLRFIYYGGKPNDPVIVIAGEGVFECPGGWTPDEITRLLAWRLEAALATCPNLSSVQYSSDAKTQHIFISPKP